MLMLLSLHNCDRSTLLVFMKLPIFYVLLCWEANADCIMIDLIIHSVSECTTVPCILTILYFFLKKKPTSMLGIHHSVGCS